MTLEAFAKILDLQGGVCAICKTPPPPGKNLVVDHDHQTGKIRGILCHKCNRAIGSLQDNLQGLRAASTYLLRYDPRRSWDMYFIQIAEVVATRSKDPSTQVGAVLVRNRNIIATGYNGFPRGVNDNIPERYERPLKYTWTIHAEENCVLSGALHGVPTAGATLYVTPLAPCTRCASAIIQCGVLEVVVPSQSSENPRWAEDLAEAARMFQAAKVLVRPPE